MCLYNRNMENKKGTFKNGHERGLPRQIMHSPILACLLEKQICVSCNGTDRCREKPKY